MYQNPGKVKSFIAAKGMLNQEKGNFKSVGKLNSILLALVPPLPWCSSSVVGSLHSQCEFLVPEGAQQTIKINCEDVF